MVEFKAGLQEIKPDVEFIPTGLQDRVICNIGKGEHDHYHVQSFNNLGKTVLWVNLVRQICAPTNNKYFQFPIFQDWPYDKYIAVVTTKENLKEAGAAYRWINQWWPSNLHDGGTKQDQHFKSLFKWKSGFTVKLFSNEQPPNQFEGPEFGLWIMDEPGRPGMVTAFNTRLKNGGFGMTIFTPVTLAGGFNPGPVLDVLEDLKTKGRKISYMVFSDINHNHIDTGLPNRFNEKRGLLSTEAMKTFISGVTSEQADARIKGTLNLRSGRVYKAFERTVHSSRDYDLTSTYAKSWNNYMVMDPHDEYYPFMLWFGVTPEEDVVIWNEWPTYRTLGNNYYDQVRKTLPCDMLIDDFADVIDLMDMYKMGMAPVMRRGLDPRYASGIKTKMGEKQSLGLVEKFRAKGLKFELAPFERIDTQRATIQEFLRYDARRWPLAGAPRLWVLPHCVSTIRALERHYYLDDGSENEGEEYKDPCDVIRYFFAMLDKVIYIPPKIVLPSQKSKSLDVRSVAVSGINRIAEEMKRIDL
jgi:hypothetical protein